MVGPQTLILYEKEREEVTEPRKCVKIIWRAQLQRTREGETECKWAHSVGKCVIVVFHVVVVVFTLQKTSAPWGV